MFSFILATVGLFGFSTSSLAILILGFLFLLIGFLRIKSRKKNERWTSFELWSSLAELFGVFFAIWFSVYSIEQANATVNDSRVQLETLKHLDTSSVETKNSLDTLSAKLKKLPGQLDKFANSLGNLNKIMEGQQKYFSENVAGLNNNISGLKQGIASTSDYIDKFSVELNRVVSLTDKQLKIWEGQQEVWKKEYSRRPKLSLFIDKEDIDIKGDHECLNCIHIKNFGNLEADIRTVFLYFPKSNFDNLYLTENIGLTKIKNDTVIFMIPWADAYSPVVDEMPTYITRPFKRKPNIKSIIKYKIDYSCRYEIKSISGEMEL